MIRLIENDPWLKPYEAQIQQRIAFTRIKEKAITQGTNTSLYEFAGAYNYYGLHKEESGFWILRELMPNAQKVYLIGSFNDWECLESYRLKPVDDLGEWVLRLNEKTLKHGDYYRLLVEWSDGKGERLPAWSSRVVQDQETGVFSAQVWSPERSYTFSYPKPQLEEGKLLSIYEAHIGMSSEEEKINSYKEFQTQVLPRIARLGYNAIQLMAIQEHPYYASFGYHVSNFFAPSSRFGTPEDLKSLIDEAHRLGLKVIMDLVHSHSVKNEVEGIANYDGSRTLFFHEGKRGEHPEWGSLCFDYGKHNVIQFLLSNCRYWLEEFNFDGFRFDGVSSMLYYNHGLGQVFTSYTDYFDGCQDAEAMVYLSLANKLIHKIDPKAITIAEEVSGMPGLAFPLKDGGLGFDYRLAMNIPDFWIKQIKESVDEDWNVEHIWYELTNRRSDERVITYSESHDQALVGDKTIIFRLADEQMYWHMARDNRNLVIDRAVALHKMIRLITFATTNGGYLNFMGNEFGHPEWIDFPRAENNWSHKYARRQWNLADNKNLLYSDLEIFDQAMITRLKGDYLSVNQNLIKYWSHKEEQVLAFGRGRLLFVFNFSPNQSYSDYEFCVPEGEYQIVLDTDSLDFGGFGLNDQSIIHYTINKGNEDSERETIALYLPARTALVLQRKA